MRILEDEVEEEKGGALESKSKKRRIEEAQEDKEENVTHTNEDLGDEDDETWRKEMRDQEQLIKETLQRQGRASEWINWEEKMEEHRNLLETP